jgi:pyruvate ferredoxin oxidoreductase delta subunit
MTEKKKAEVDYDFCKGCGICAHECKSKSIEMLKEGSL